jgi:thiol-disulfide isomerase/thioredoxin
MPLDATIGTSFLNTYGKTSVDLQTFAGDSPLVGIYFSAHWCGPCRNFTPKLVTFLAMLEEEGVRLPVVFGSSDKDEASFQSYFSSMTGDQWHAFPLGDARNQVKKAATQRRRPIRPPAHAPVAPAPDRAQPRPAKWQVCSGRPATHRRCVARRRASRRSRSSLA